MLAVSVYPSGPVWGVAPSRPLPEGVRPSVFAVAKVFHRTQDGAAVRCGIAKNFSVLPLSRLPAKPTTDLDSAPAWALSCAVGETIGMYRCARFATGLTAQERESRVARRSALDPTLTLAARTLEPFGTRNVALRHARHPPDHAAVQGAGDAPAVCSNFVLALPVGG